MSDFPKGGDIVSTRAWLDKEGFEVLFAGWNADALLGADKSYIITKAGKDEGERLWGLLNTARNIEDPVNISKFLWKDVDSSTERLFPKNKFGQYVLQRDRVVKNVKKVIALQMSSDPGEGTSVYLAGCRGSGKTCMQMLLARSLQAEGYVVYFFDSARRIPQGASFAFESLLEDKTKKVAVLIDEVASNPESEILTTLLKSNHPHLVTIGSSVPRFLSSGVTAYFKTVLRMTDLVLKEEDEDFQELVQYCVGLKATTPELTQAICNYLLKQCGGHTYPTLAFIEHFFTRDDEVSKMHLTSEEEFRRYFVGPDFASSTFYEGVKERCFVQFLDAETEKVAFRVLGGNEETGDISTLTRLGWWDPEVRDFISPFLKNTCLSNVQPKTSDVLYLDVKKSHEENTEMVIVAGLEGMNDADFYCHRHISSVKVEDGVSFNWAQKARAKIPNAYISFQERTGTGLVDFYLNGFADTAIEVMLNATQTFDPKSKPQSQDIDDHLKRFTDGKYPWKRYVLLNFDMSSGDKLIIPVLPRDTSAHEKVYTFVRSTNALYRGKKILKFPVIPNLSDSVILFSPTLLHRRKCIISLVEDDGPTITHGDDPEFE